MSYCEGVTYDGVDGVRRTKLRLTSPKATDASANNTPVVMSFCCILEVAWCVRRKLIKAPMAVRGKLAANIFGWWFRVGGFAVAIAYSHQEFVCGFNEGGWATSLDKQTRHLGTSPTPLLVHLRVVNNYPYHALCLHRSIEQLKLCCQLVCLISVVIIIIDDDNLVI